MNVRVSSRRSHMGPMLIFATIALSPAIAAQEEIALNAGALGDATTATAGASTANPPASVSAELLRSIRAATFEVVQQKDDPERDPVRYERPLPFDSIPFAQRNDKYISIGTAFAIDGGRFVTAAHVTSSVSGSLRGAPALRDAQGRIYPIDKVLRFALHEDFIVFSVRGAPQVVPLQTNTRFEIDTSVIAVGNALGEGVVARDGRLTSETPEDQDGRWKWLRFSAPASPGNSGGPLLDQQGRVIGVIARKSANENLNYALPIARVLEAPEGRATIDSRYRIALPFMAAAREAVTLQASFALPLPYAEFDQRLLAATNQHADASLQQLLQKSTPSIYPRGRSSRLLADTQLNSNPSIITLQPDGTWDLTRTNPVNPAQPGGPPQQVGNSAQLGDDGTVWAQPQAGVGLFRIEYPSDLDVSKERGNSRLLGEHLVQALRLSRTVGREQVRILGLGEAAKPQELRDRYGRVWQLFEWPVAFADSLMIVAALPMPDGYVGMARMARGFSRDSTIADLRLLLDHVQASYSGTLPRWRAFLADERLRPAAFARWKMTLDPAATVRVELPRFTMTVDREVLPVTEQSHLSIIPGVMMVADRPEWDVLALSLNLEKRRTAGVIAVRRARPAADAGPVPTQRWADMTALRASYSGMPVRNNAGGFARKVVGPEGVPLADAPFLYDLSYNTSSSVQGEVARAIARLPGMFVVREK